MPTEMINPPKKAPGNSILKSLSAEKQQDIAQHAREHTLEQTREYLVSRHQITASLPTISRFLAWYEDEEQMGLMDDAVERVMDRVEARHPDWTPEKIQSAGQAYFAAYAIQQKNVRAWWQIQSLSLKEKKLALDRDKFERTHIESIVRTCKNIKVRKIAQDDKKNYTQKIAEIGQIMFGDEADQTVVEPASWGTVESESNTQHSTFNAQHSTAEEAPSTNGATAGAEENIQQPTSNTQQPVEGGKGEGANIQHSTLNAQHSGNGTKATISKHQAPEKNQNSNSQTFNIQHSTLNTQHSTIRKPATFNLQPSTLCGKHPKTNPEHPTSS